jgi:hypothetical protein
VREDLDLGTEEKHGRLSTELVLQKSAEESRLNDSSISENTWHDGVRYRHDLEGKLLFNTRNLYHEK